MIIMIIFCLKTKRMKLDHVKSYCLNINCNNKRFCILITNLIIHVRYKSGDFMTYMFYATEKSI